MELPYSNIKKFSYVLLFLETETLKKIPFRETKTEAGKSFLYLRKRKPRKKFLYFRKQNFHTFQQMETLKNFLCFMK